MDSMEYSFGPYENNLCDYRGINHFLYNCPSNPESHYFMEDGNWDTSHFNGYTQSWEDHPNLCFNGQDHGNFTSPRPPYQDWSNTYSNTFDQSWDEQVDFSKSFNGDDFYNSFLPPTQSLEQVEISESFKTLMIDYLQNLNESVDRMTTSVNNMTFYVEEIISEQNVQSQIPIPSTIEKFEYVGVDEDEAITLESFQEIEISEEAKEHLSNPSSLQISEEVQQNAKIIINPFFESMQKEHTVADVTKSLQQRCAENFQIVLKKGCDDQSKGSGSFTKSSSIVGKVMWKTPCGVKYSPIYAIEVLCHDHKAKEVIRKVYKHKWKEKHQELVRTIRVEDHTDVL